MGREENHGRVRFSVPGEAVQKDRPRFFKRQIYTPLKTKAFQFQVGLYAAQAMQGRQPWQCPMELCVKFYRSPADSWSRRRRQAAIEQAVVPVSKPDIDNLAKAVMDALNGIVYLDDAQVYRLDALQLYGHESKTVVQVIPRPDLVYAPRIQKRHKASNQTKH